MTADDIRKAQLAEIAALEQSVAIYRGLAEKYERKLAIARDQIAKGSDSHNIYREHYEPTNRGLSR